MSGMIIKNGGDVTLDSRLMSHLGVEPGDIVEVQTMPHGELRIRAVRTAVPAPSFFGILKRPGQRAMDIQDIQRAIESGWTKPQ